MVKIAICDDEELVLGQLKAVVTEILTQWKEDFGITCFSGPHGV